MRMQARNRRPFLLAVPFCLGAAWGTPLSAGPQSAAAGTTKEAEKLPAGLEVVRVEVFPGAIELKGRHAYRQLLVTGILEGGERADLTRLAEIAASAPVVEVLPGGRVTARGDGEAVLLIAACGKSLEVPVTVSGQEEPFQASFVQDVMPILSRAGCNGGTCHGAAKGKNGFKLSLRGNDPLFDHRALTDDLAGRRFNRAAPEKSLFLLKTTGAVPHTGGVVVEPGSDYYQILRSWVAGGVRLDLDSPRVAGIEIHPRDLTVPLPGMRQQMAVIATYTDGRVRDVTAESFVETSNTEVLKVDQTGVVTALRRGEAAVLARYEGRYAATPLFVMGDRDGFEWHEVPEYNKVDTLVYAKLRRIKTLPSDVCTDAEFLRRVYLDLTGLPPRVKDTRAFLVDRRDSRLKREEVVDRLLGSAEFVEHWTRKWADLLQVNRKFLGKEGAERFRDWIRAAVASNMPYDRFASAILTASGSTYENPPAAYFKILRQPDAAMENTTQLFLGVRFNCNKCHDHPFERWTQGNHWELAAYFAQVGRKDAPGSPKMPPRDVQEGPPPALEEIIFDKDEGEVTAPYSGQTVAPAFPYTYGEAAPAGETRREQLAKWLTSAGNPYFAKSYVNRLWSYLMGVGLIEPADDIRAGNPPTNPELLEWLMEEFIESGMDTRRLLRFIVTSRVYQHSIRTNEWNEDDTVNYSHAIARRLPAETLYDAIHLGVGSWPRLPGERAGILASETLDSSVKLSDGFLDLFGRPPRESPCECERASGMSLGQALSLVNGPTVAGAIQDPQNAIASLVAVETRPSRILEDLYLSILCRPPSAEEDAELAAAVDFMAPETAAALSPEDYQELEKRRLAWEERERPVTWEALELSIARSAGGATFERREDGSLLAGGASPEKDTYTLVAWTDLRGVTGVRIEVLPDDSLPKKGPGRAENGNLVLSEIRLAAAPAADPSEARRVALVNPTADFSQQDYPVALAVDGKAEKGWAIAPELGRRHQAVFETQEDAGAEGGTILTFTLEQQFGGKHTLGRFRISVTTGKRPVRVPSLPEDIVGILAKPRAERTAEEQAALYRQWLATDGEMQGRIRLAAAQDLAWALVNSPAFLFNR